LKYRSRTGVIMDLDLAIQNTLKRSPMESAMHGVLSDFGGTYQLNAYTESANAAESILGTPVAIMAPNSNARAGESYAATPTPVTKSPPSAGPFSESFDGYRLDHSNNTWTLYRLQTEKAGFWGRLSGKTDSVSEVPVITREGTRAAQRFLTTLEDPSLPIPAPVRSQIAAAVMANLQAGTVNVVQGGYSLDTDPSDDTIEMAGARPFSAEGFGSTGPMELRMAPLNNGVAVQRNNTFMGDTLVPKPISNAQIGNLRTPLGDPVGVHIAPPTKVGTQSALRNSRSV